MKHLFIIVFTLISLSCAGQTKSKLSKAQGTVFIGIPVAADGCGNIIQIDSVNYKADNIPQKYQIDNLKVCIKYTSGPTFYCGRGQAPIATINIVSIKKARRKCVNKA